MAIRKKSPTRKEVTREESLLLASAPQVRTFTDWTTPKIRAAQRQADSGNLYQAASLCEWILTDDRVAGSLDARLDSLFGLPVTFEPGAGRKKNQAIKALEAGEDWWESYPEQQLRLIHKWGLILGVAPAIHRWKEHPDHGDRILPSPDFWHPQTLRQDHRTHEWSVENAIRQRVPVAPGDGQWLLHMPFGKHRPWAQGLCWSLALWVIVKQLAMQDWSRHSERGAMLVISSPDRSTKETRRELAQAMRDAGEDAVVALAAGFDMKLLEVAANTERIYRAQIEMADLAIAIRIRGGNLSSQVDGGSKAAAQVQVDVNETPKLRFDASTISTTAHDQSLIWWAEFNFGDRRLAPWPTYPVQPEEDKKALAEALKALAESIESLQTAGVPFDLKELAERFTLKLEDVPEGIKGRIYQYHLTFGIFTINEIRERAGMPPVSWGNEKPEPALGASTGGGDDGSAQNTTRQPKAFALASGARMQEAEGFVAGQLYADNLAEEATQRALRSMSADEAAILREIEAATDYEDLRERLRALYRSQEPDVLRTLLARAMSMAHLAGRHAVNEDT